MEGAITPEQAMEMDAAFASELMRATGSVMEKAKRQADRNTGMAGRNTCPTKRDVGGGRSEMHIGDMGQLRDFLKRQKGL